MPAPSARPQSAVRAPNAAIVGRHRRQRTAFRDRLLVLAVALTGVSLALLAAVQTARRMQASRAEAAMATTFTRVHERQTVFHRTNARYADWSELPSRERLLGPRQSVQRSNADASHWFLSIIDQETGVICDRIGELFDEPGEEKKARCRKAAGNS